MFSVDASLTQDDILVIVEPACFPDDRPVSLPQMYDRTLSAPTSPTKMEAGGQRSWEEPSWMGSSPRVLNPDMKASVSRSLQTLPTSAHCFEPGTTPGLGYDPRVRVRPPS